jgi:hypothetical protein
MKFGCALLHISKGVTRCGCDGQNRGVRIPLVVAGVFESTFFAVVVSEFFFF